MRALQFVHEVSISKDFQPDLYKAVFENFNSKFEEVKIKYKISETLKIHVIKDHFMYYFEQTGENFSKTNGENLESCHSALRIHEERHKFRYNRKIGTPSHGEVSARSLIFYNGKRAQMTPTFV